MLVIILCGIRFAAEIIVPLFSHYLLLLFLTRWCNTWSVACAACTGGVDFDDHHRDGDVLLLAYLGSALNELTRTLPHIATLL